jgi:hypothetical protein
MLLQGSSKHNNEQVATTTTSSSTPGSRNRPRGSTSTSLCPSKHVLVASCCSCTVIDSRQEPAALLTVSPQSPSGPF